MPNVQQAVKLGVGTARMAEYIEREAATRERKEE